MMKMSHDLGGILILHPEILGTTDLYKSTQYYDLTLS